MSLTSLVLVIAAATITADAGPKDRYLAALRTDETIAAEVRQRAAEAVERVAGNAATAHEAITAGLQLASSEFAAALQALADDQPAKAAEQLQPLTQSPNSFLAAESKFFLARALIAQEQFEDAQPLLKQLSDESANDTLRAAEALYLRGKTAAATLDIKKARKSLERFLDDYEDAPRRLRQEAEATLIDLQEAEEDMLAEIHSKMDFSRRRLQLTDAGSRTQFVQEEVVALLTEMIDEMEKKCGSCKGCKSGCKPGGSKPGGAAPGNSRGLSEAPRLTERDGPRTPWVDLSQRQPDPTAFNAAKRRAPLQYKDLVEQYYRSFREPTDKTP